MTQVDFAAHDLVHPLQRNSDVRREARGEPGDGFAGALGTTPEFWINLQAAYDLVVSRPARPVRRMRRTE